MLAFDIETTSLTPEAGEVTCICAHDPEAGVSMTIHPPLGDPVEPFFALLDASGLLCAFNGVRFDLPFLQAKYGLAPERVGRWVLKLVDPYEACHQAFGRAFSLNALLRANGIPSKIESGAGAILLARDKQWARLAEYCMDDTVKTHRVASLPRITLPLRAFAPAFLADGRFAAA